MMKKKSSKAYIILASFFVLVSIIIFAIPSTKTVAFWISYIFTVLAFASQIVIWKISLGSAESLKSKFLAFPVIYIGIVYLVIQIFALSVFLFIRTLPIWSAVVSCAVIAGISAICMIASTIGRNEIESISAKVQEKTFYIKQLQSDVELLADAETNIVTKSALTQLSEKIRYSDPMSDSQVTNIEKQISAKITELKFSMDKARIIDELNLLLDERNRKIKFLK